MSSLKKSSGLGTYEGKTEEGDEILAECLSLTLDSLPQVTFDFLVSPLVRACACA